MFGYNFTWLALVAALVYTSLSHAQDTDTTNGTAASVFISPAKDLAFGLNVASDSPGTFYFTIQVPVAITWGAIGLGTHTMGGALMLVAYLSSSGKNVTLSPRLGTGHSEPVYAPYVDVEALPGTGLLNETTYVYNGRCNNCYFLSKPFINIDNKEQKMIYATGEFGDIKSDDVEYSLGMHFTYGTFTMDMVHATGPGGVPEIDTSGDLKSVAATLGMAKAGKKDRVAMLHAIIMVFTFVGLFPFGSLVLRFGKWVRWHGINQVLGLVLVIIGFGLGVHSSKFYNRTKKFNTAHQVIGILVFAFVFIQFSLGFMHHRQFKKTQQKTKMAPIHAWFGRLIIILGVVNGFLGFTLAYKTTYNYALLGLVLFIFPAIILILLTKKLLRKRWDKTKGVSTGYDLEPWHQAAAGQQVPAPGVSQPTVAYPPRVELGPQQNTREYV